MGVFHAVLVGVLLGNLTRQERPLAYVRAAVLLPPQVLVDLQKPHGAAAAGQPSATMNGQLALRTHAVARFAQTLHDRLARVPGLTVTPAPTPIPSHGDQVTYLARSGADALVAPIVEGFGARGSTQRELWLQVSARVVRADGTVLGPYHAYGWASTLRISLFKGLVTSDEKLAEAAGDQAGRELAHALISGTEPLFADWRAAAIVPAAVPQVVAKRLASGTSVAVPLPSLRRAADVLFQPAIPPFVPLASPQRVWAALRRLGLRPEDLWAASGDPDVGYAVRVAKLLHVDYLFVSRVQDLALSEETLSVPDGSTMKPGVERRADATAEAALIRVSDGAVLWRDRLSGGTAARTEYVRHVPRLRTDEQCVGDAARIAYAYLRFSLDDYRRSLVREKAGVVAK